MDVIILVRGVRAPDAVISTVDAKSDMFMNTDLKLTVRLCPS